MTELPPQTSRIKQSIAVTLVTALVLSMPGVTGWADSNTSTANQPSYAVQPDGQTPDNSYKPLIGRAGASQSTLQAMGLFQQTVQALVNIGADLTGVTKTSLQSNGIGGLQSINAQVGHTVETTAPNLPTTITDHSSPAYFAVDSARSLLAGDMPIFDDSLPSVPGSASVGGGFELSPDGNTSAPGQIGSMTLKQQPPTLDADVAALQQQQKSIVSLSQNLVDMSTGAYVSLAVDLNWKKSTANELQASLEMDNKTIQDDQTQIAQLEKEISLLRQQAESVDYQVSGGAQVGLNRDLDTLSTLQKAVQKLLKTDGTINDKADPQGTLNARLKAAQQGIADDEKQGSTLHNLIDQLRQYNTPNVNVPTIDELNAAGWKIYDHQKSLRSSSGLQNGFDVPIFLPGVNLPTISINSHHVGAFVGGGVGATVAVVAGAVILGAVVAVSWPLLLGVAVGGLVVTAAGAAIGAHFDRANAGSNPTETAAQDKTTLNSAGLPPNLQKIQDFLTKSQSSSKYLIENISEALNYAKTLAAASRVTATATQAIQAIMATLKDIENGGANARQRLLQLGAALEGSSFVKQYGQLSTQDLGSVLGAKLRGSSQNFFTSNIGDPSKNSFKDPFMSGLMGLQNTINSSALDIVNANATSLLGPDGKPLTLNGNTSTQTSYDAVLQTVRQLAAGGNSWALAFARQNSLPIFDPDTGNVVDANTLASQILNGSKSDDLKLVDTYNNYANRWQTEYGGVLNKMPWNTVPEAWNQADNWHQGLWNGFQAAVGSAFDTVTDPLHAAFGGALEAVGSWMPSDSYLGTTFKEVGASQVGNSFYAQALYGDTALNEVEKAFGYNSWNPDNQFFLNYDNGKAGYFNTGNSTLDSVLTQQRQYLMQQNGQFISGGAADLLGSINVTSGMSALAAKGYAEGWSGAGYVAAGLGVQALQTGMDVAAFGGINGAIEGGVEALGEGAGARVFGAVLKGGLVQLPAAQFGLTVAKGLGSFGDAFNAYMSGDMSTFANDMGNASVSVAGTLLGVGGYAMGASLQSQGFVESFKIGATDVFKTGIQGALILGGGGLFGDIGSLGAAVGSNMAAEYLPAMNVIYRQQADDFNLMQQVMRLTDQSPELNKIIQSTLVSRMEGVPVDQLTSIAEGKGGQLNLAPQDAVSQIGGSDTARWFAKVLGHTPEEQLNTPTDAFTLDGSNQNVIEAARAELARRSIEMSASNNVSSEMTASETSAASPRVELPAEFYAQPTETLSTLKEAADKAYEAWTADQSPANFKIYNDNLDALKQASKLAPTLEAMSRLSTGSSFLNVLGGGTAMAARQKTEQDALNNAMNAASDSIRLNDNVIQAAKKYQAEVDKGLSADPLELQQAKADMLDAQAQMRAAHSGADNPAAQQILVQSFEAKAELSSMWADAKMTEATGLDEKGQHLAADQASLAASQHQSDAAAYRAQADLVSARFGGDRAVIMEAQQNLSIAKAGQAVARAQIPLMAARTADATARTQVALAMASGDASAIRVANANKAYTENRLVLARANVDTTTARQTLVTEPSNTLAQRSLSDAQEQVNTASKKSVVLENQRDAFNQLDQVQQSVKAFEVTKETLAKNADGSFAAQTMNRDILQNAAADAGVTVNFGETVIADQINQAVNDITESLQNNLGDAQRVAQLAALEVAKFNSDQANSGIFDRLVDSFKTLTASMPLLASMVAPAVAAPKVVDPVVISADAAVEGRDTSFTLKDQIELLRARKEVGSLTLDHDKGFVEALNKSVASLPESVQAKGAWMRSFFEEDESNRLVRIGYDGKVFKLEATEAGQKDPNVVRSINEFNKALDEFTQASGGNFKSFYRRQIVQALQAVGAPRTFIVEGTGGGKTKVITPSIAYLIKTMYGAEVGKIVVALPDESLLGQAYNDAGSVFKTLTEQGHSGANAIMIKADEFKNPSPDLMRRIQEADVVYTTRDTLKQLKMADSASADSGSFESTAYKTLTDRGFVIVDEAHQLRMVDLIQGGSPQPLEEADPAIYNALTTADETINGMEDAPKDSYTKRYEWLARQVNKQGEFDAAFIQKYAEARNIDPQTLMESTSEDMKAERAALNAFAEAVTAKHRAENGYGLSPDDLTSGRVVPMSLGKPNGSMRWSDSAMAGARQIVGARLLNGSEGLKLTSDQLSAEHLLSLAETNGSSVRVTDVSFLRDFAGVIDMSGSPQGVIEREAISLGLTPPKGYSASSPMLRLSDQGMNPISQASFARVDNLQQMAEKAASEVTGRGISVIGVESNNLHNFEYSDALVRSLTASGDRIVLLQKGDVIEVYGPDGKLLPNQASSEFLGDFFDRGEGPKVQTMYLGKTLQEYSDEILNSDNSADPRTLNVSIVLDQGGVTGSDIKMPFLKIGDAVKALQDVLSGNPLSKDQIANLQIDPASAKFIKANPEEVEAAINARIMELQTAERMNRLLRGDPMSESEFISLRSDLAKLGDSGVKGAKDILALLSDKSGDGLAKDGIFGDKALSENLIPHARDFYAKVFNDYLDQGPKFVSIFDEDTTAKRLVQTVGRDRGMDVASYGYHQKAIITIGEKAPGDAAALVESARANESKNNENGIYRGFLSDLTEVMLSNFDRMMVNAGNNMAEREAIISARRDFESSVGRNDSLTVKSSDPNLNAEDQTAQQKASTALQQDVLRLQEKFKAATNSYIKDFSKANQEMVNGVTSEEVRLQFSGQGKVWDDPTLTLEEKLARFGDRSLLGRSFKDAVSAIGSALQESDLDFGVGASHQSPALVVQNRIELVRQKLLAGTASQEDLNSLRSLAQQSVLAGNRQGSSLPARVVAIANASGLSTVQSVLLLGTQPATPAAPPAGVGSLSDIWQTTSRIYNVSRGQNNSFVRSIYHAVSRTNPSLPADIALQSTLNAFVQAQSASDQPLDSGLNSQTIAGINYQNLMSLAASGALTLDQISVAAVRARASLTAGPSTDAINTRLNEVLATAATSSPRKITVGDGFTVQQVKKNGVTVYAMTVDHTTALGGLKAVALAPISKLPDVRVEIHGNAAQLRAFQGLVNKENQAGANIRLVKTSDASLFARTISLGVRRLVSWGRTASDSNNPIDLLTQAVSSIEQKAPASEIGNRLLRLRAVAGQMQEAMDLGLIRKDHLTASVQFLIEELARASNSNADARAAIETYLQQSVSDAHAGSTTSQGLPAGAPAIKLKPALSPVALMHQALQTGPEAAILRGTLDPQAAAETGRRIRANHPAKAQAYAALTSDLARYRMDLVDIIDASQASPQRAHKVRRSQPALSTLRRSVDQAYLAAPSLLNETLSAQLAGTPDALVVVPASFDYATIASLRATFPSVQVITEEAYQDHQAQIDQMADQARQNAIQAMLPTALAEKVAAPKPTFSDSIRSSLGQIFIGNPLPVLAQRPILVSAMLAATTAFAAQYFLPHGIFPDVSAMMTPLAALFSGHSHSAVGMTGLSMVVGAGGLRPSNSKQSLSARARALGAILTNA